MCYLHIPTLPERSQTGFAIINSDREAIHCLAQGHIDRFFILLAWGFELATSWLMAQRSNRKATQ
jgi:hypothetical protein